MTHLYTYEKVIVIRKSESLGVIVRYGGSFDSDAVCGVLSGGGFVFMSVFGAFRSKKIVLVCLLVSHRSFGGIRNHMLGWQ